MLIDDFRNIDYLCYFVYRDSNMANGTLKVEWVASKRQRIVGVLNDIYLGWRYRLEPVDGKRCDERHQGGPWPIELIPTDDIFLNEDDAKNVAKARNSASVFTCSTGA